VHKGIDLEGLTPRRVMIRVDEKSRSGSSTSWLTIAAQVFAWPDDDARRDSNRTSEMPNINKRGGVAYNKRKIIRTSGFSVGWMALGARVPLNEKSVIIRVFRQIAKSESPKSAIKVSWGLRFYRHSFRRIGVFFPD